MAASGLGQARRAAFVPQMPGWTCGRPVGLSVFASRRSRHRGTVAVGDRSWHVCVREIVVIVLRKRCETKATTEKCGVSLPSGGPSLRGPLLSQRRPSLSQRALFSAARALLSTAALASALAIGESATALSFGGIWDLQPPAAPSESAASAAARASAIFIPALPGRAYSYTNTTQQNCENTKSRWKPRTRPSDPRPRAPSRVIRSNVSQSGHVFAAAL